MGRTLAYERVEGLLDELSYPLVRSDAAVELADTTLVLPDGEVNLGALISETDSDAFHGVADLDAELEAVVEDLATE